MNRTTEMSLPFPVNNPDLQDFSVSAFFEVVGQQCPDIPGRKGMQIQDAINREYYGVPWVIHGIRPFGRS